MEADSEKNCFSRGAFIRTLAAAGLALPSCIKPAYSAYTVVSTGDIAEKQARLLEVEMSYAVNPSDPYIFGEKAQLEYDLKQLRANSQFVRKLSSDIEAGTGKFLQRLTLPVDDINAAVNFWRNGMGALVQSTRIENGANMTVMSFGPETLRRDDGGKFAIELVEAGQGVRGAPESQVFQYVQLGMPVFRLSQVMANGGEIVSAYGWTNLVAPGGIPLRVRIDESRRDPFEFVAIRASNMKAAIKHYEGLGMTAGKPSGGRKLDFAGSTIFEDSDALEPDREVGSVLMSFGDPSSSTGILLLPPKSRKALALPAPLRLRAVANTSPAQAPDVKSPDGLGIVFTTPEAYEASV
eukprot:2225273-Pleurochrysis_carterae.AAC.1